MKPLEEVIADLDLRHCAFGLGIYVMDADINKYAILEVRKWLE